MPRLPKRPASERARRMPQLKAARPRRKVRLLKADKRLWTSIDCIVPSRPAKGDMQRARAGAAQVLAA